MYNREYKIIRQRFIKIPHCGQHIGLVIKYEGEPEVDCVCSQCGEFIGGKR